MTASLERQRPVDAERCEIGEGPTYDAHTDIAWWFDIPAWKLFEHRFTTHETIVHNLPFYASALARIDGKRQLLATEAGLHVRDVATGCLTLHREIEADDDTTRSNDARTHPSGAFWIGTIGKKEEEGRGSIYWYRRGEVRRIFGGISVTNSICFSPSGDRGYFTDTRTRQILTVALDPLTGLPKDDPTAFGPTDLPGDPDGAVTDAEGRLFVARHGGSCVSVLDPSGRHLGDIPLPTAQVTCPAFVGRDASKLLVTTSFAGYDKDRRKAEPDAGATFLVDVGAAGRFDPDVLIE